jgi:peroxiredoxin
MSTTNKNKIKNSGNELNQIIKNIKLKVSIYNSLVNKKKKEVNGLESNIKLIKDYNTFAKKSGENQELLCEENKIMTEEIINEFNELNQFEQELKGTIYESTNRSSIKSAKSQMSTTNKNRIKNNGNDLNQIIKNIKLKVSIYNSLVNKKKKEVNGLELNIKLIKDYNTFAKKSGENQELLCEENKIMTDEIINEFNELNQFEQELKGEIDFLNQKLISNKDNQENNLSIIQNNSNMQLNTIKERESYIVKQSEQITDGLKKIANQKKEAVDILKKENQQLKNRNYIINK